MSKLPSRGNHTKDKKRRSVSTGRVFALVIPKNRPACSPLAAMPGGETGALVSHDDSGAAATAAVGAVASTVASHAINAMANRLMEGPQVSRLRVGRTRDIAQNASRYFGPIGPTDGLECYAIQVASVTDVVSSGAGIINTVFTTDPSATPDWSSYAAIFDEYRVLALMVEYQPINRYAPVASPGGITQQVPWFIVIDLDDVAPITTRPQVTAYGGSVEIHNTTDPWKRSVRMSGGPDDNWVTTATPTSTYAVKTFAQSASASVTYGTCLVRALVQFRSSD